jgi:hypothetical protein
MKRREFILASAGITAYGLLPKMSFGRSLLQGESFTTEAYDDNKVVRIYDPKVSNYNFGGESIYWKTIDQEVLSQMLSKSLHEISGEKNEAKAWKMILAGSKKADLTNKRVAVKVNFNNTIRDIHTTLNNSPAMMGVLAKSMMEAGIQQANICIFDCARPFPDELKAEVRKFGLDQIVMLGKNDNPAVSVKTVFLSDNKDFPRDGKPTDQYPIPQLLIDSDYLINLHLVKMHSTGVTGAMKNLFGIAGNVAFHMHHKGPKSFPVSNHLPDLSLNQEIKQRVRLNIAEFIFGGHCPDTIDKFENEAFFPDGRPSSLIVSRSPFYQDTVLYGFIKAEYDKANPEKLRKDMSKIGPDTWLKNSSQQYAAWKYDQAGFVASNRSAHPQQNLSFKEVNFVSI